MNCKIFFSIIFSFILFLNVAPVLAVETCATKYKDTDGKCTTEAKCPEGTTPDSTAGLCYAGAITSIALKIHIYKNNDYL